MTIEQRIAELMAESQKFDEASNAATKDAVAAEANNLKPVTTEDNPDNKKGNDAATSAPTAPTTKEDSNVANKDAQAVDKAGNPGKKNEDISVDVSADVAALIEGETLSEEFKTKAATIFEAAVLSRVKAEVAKIDEAYAAEFNTKLEEAVAVEVEGLIEKVDGYLSYMAEEWMIENELALESGIKTEITENFMAKLKNVFEESYIDIPEDKVDVVAEMEAAVVDLENKLQESEAHNIEMHKQIAEQARVTAIAMQVEGLTDVEADKFKSLAEELSYESDESFSAKLKVIRESYFAKKPVEVKTEMISESASIVEEKSVAPSVAAYAQFLSR